MSKTIPLIIRNFPKEEHVMAKTLAQSQGITLQEFNHRAIQEKIKRDTPKLLKSLSKRG